MVLLQRVFDVSKSETFIPLLWVYFKVVYFSVFMYYTTNFAKLDEIWDIHLNFKNKVYMFSFLYFLLCEETCDERVLAYCTLFQNIKISCLMNSIAILTDMCVISIVFGMHTLRQSELCLLSDTMYFGLAWLLCSSLLGFHELTYHKQYLLDFMKFKRLAPYTGNMSYICYMFPCFAAVSRCFTMQYSLVTTDFLVYRAVLYTSMVILRFYTTAHMYSAHYKPSHNIVMFGWLFCTNIYMFYCVCVLMLSIFVVKHLHKSSNSRQHHTITLEEGEHESEQMFQKLEISDNVKKQLRYIEDTQVTGQPTLAKRDTVSLFN